MSINKIIGVMVTPILLLMAIPFWALALPFAWITNTGTSHNKYMPLILSLLKTAFTYKYI